MTYPVTFRHARGTETRDLRRESLAGTWRGNVPVLPR